MADAHFDAELIVNMLSKMLGGIDGAMLSARTTEAEHQRGKATLDISAHMVVCQLIDGVEEGKYLTIVLQETDNRLIKSRYLSSPVTFL